MDERILKNRFTGYLEKFKDPKKINPVREIVNLYYVLSGVESRPAAFYKGRYGYGKLAKEAKELLKACNGSIEDAMWALDKMKYKAERGKFDWSISTCLKHDLL